MAQQRLDKYLSNAGCGTRTEVKQLLKKGLVTVNGVPAAKPEQKIDSEQDKILCRGIPVLLEHYRYFMLYKPAGYLSATEDRHQPVVMDLIKEKKKEDLFPVGRLDIDTEGLLLLTNDGALAHDLLSPKKHVDKTYFAKICGQVTEEDCVTFREGLDIGEKKKTLPAQLVILSVYRADGGSVAADGPEECEPGNQKREELYTEIEITIQEGKYHQIKRMFEAVGKKVVYLKRLSMGSLRLDETLQPGEYRSLTEQEIEGLREHAGK